MLLQVSHGANGLSQERAYVTGLTAANLVIDKCGVGQKAAVLDVEPTLAMGHARGLVLAGQGEAALAALAEATTRNDPTFNHAHQFLALAAAADLLPHLPGCAGEAMLTALAKSLANSQGSGDLGRLADKALGH